MTNLALYDTWIAELYNHEEEDGIWAFDYSGELDTLEDETVLDLFSTMCENFDKDVSQYTNWQITEGLKYILSTDRSDMSRAFSNDQVWIDSRLSAIRSIPALFEQGFQQRCSNSMFGSVQNDNPLNDICYEFWVIGALGFCSGLNDEKALGKAYVKVMRECVANTNTACSQSGIRGLARLSGSVVSAKNALNDLVSQAYFKHPELREYALKASEQKIHT